jgi:hypothetical protein
MDENQSQSLHPATFDDEPAEAEEAAQPAEAPAEASGAGSVDLQRVRDLVLAANPDVVPEMIAGDTFDALLASVEPAKAAYARIAASVQSAAPPAVAGQTGGSRQYVINVEELSPSAKISEGLRRLK